MFTKVKELFQKETVCCIAFLLAVISMCFVVPSKNYISYIDFRVLALLFCLMAVVRGFSSIGVFTRLGTMLLTHVHSLRMLSALFIFLCFFFSMLITNDVALITFVPFTILVLSMAEQKKFLIPVIVLETIAANLGSMLTPLGNPQNLYLYTISGLSIGAFVRIMLPYSFVSAILLLIFILFLPKDTVSTATAANTANSTNTVTASNTSNVICEAVKTRKNSRILFAFYLILFLLCLLTVLHILPACFRSCGCSIPDSVFPCPHRLSASGLPRIKGCGLFPAAYLSLLLHLYRKYEADFSGTRTDFKAFGPP